MALLYKGKKVIKVVNNHKAKFDRTINFAITDMCNLKCPYCQQGTFNDDGTVIDKKKISKERIEYETKLLEDAFDQLNELFCHEKSRDKKYSVTLTGGECTILPLHSLVKRLSKGVTKYVLIDVLSNGTASIDYYRSLKKDVESRGLAFNVNFSIHETEVNVENMYKKIDTLIAEGTLSSVNCVLTNDNADYVRSLEKRFPGRVTAQPLRITPSMKQYASYSETKKNENQCDDAYINNKNYDAKGSKKQYNVYTDDGKVYNLSRIEMADLRDENNNIDFTGFDCLTSITICTPNEWNKFYRWTTCNRNNQSNKNNKKFDIDKITLTEVCTYNSCPLCGLIYATKN